VQVYQFRHLSITPPATHTGLFLGLLLYVEVLGYFSDHVVFWLGFVLFYLGVTNYIILKIYRSEELAHQPESLSPKRVSIRYKEYIIRGIFEDLFFIFYILYSTLLHLPPLRFHCADGCWDRTQDRCYWCIGSQTLYMNTRLDLIRLG
jgi:hypothetical protein